MIAAAEELSGAIPTTAACEVLGVARATLYRHRTPHPPREPKPRCPSPRALSPVERQAVRDVANSERFSDLAPAPIVATLLDEGRYLCSVRTMYRILAERGEIRERRNQLCHPAYAKPELLATEPTRTVGRNCVGPPPAARSTRLYSASNLDAQAT